MATRWRRRLLSPPLRQPAGQAGCAAQLAAQFAPVGDRPAPAPAAAKRPDPAAISSRQRAEPQRRVARQCRFEQQGAARARCRHAERRRADPREVARAPAGRAGNGRGGAAAPARSAPASSRTRSVASATPTCARNCISPSVSARLATIAATATLTGVARVLVREEPGRQHLDEHEGRQPGGIGGQCRRGRRRLGRAERAALRTAPSRIGCRQHDQRHRRRQGQQQRQFDPAVLRRRPRRPTSPSRTWRDSGGRIAVPTAMPTTPSGSWFSRSA